MTCAQHLASPAGLEGWTPVFTVPAPEVAEVAAPSTPPALLEAVRAEKLLAQLQAVQKAFLESKLGPRRSSPTGQARFGGPVVVAPPAGILYTVQLAESVAAEALLV